MTVQAATGPGTERIPPELYEAQAALEERYDAMRSRAADVAPFSAVAENGETSRVIGFGIGEKQVDGRYTGRMAVQVYVTKKLPARMMPQSALVPEEESGVDTDVIEIGEVYPLGFQSRERPARCGSSIGRSFVGAGTIGCLVELENGRICILSNNHVLAASNRGRRGDRIIQPGSLDGGRDADAIALLEDFVRISFPGPNRVDAAVAFTSFSRVSPRHHNFSIDPEPVEAAVNMSVRKEGRTTGHTLGDIEAINVRIDVPYDTGGPIQQVATFQNQIRIRGRNLTTFSNRGDSGAAILAAGTSQPVGLLFAGNGVQTFANPIGEVMDALRIAAIVGGDEA